MIQETFSPQNPIRSWKGDIPLSNLYTVGPAGEIFLRELKKGKLVAIKCACCKTAFLPPRGFCERCFSRLDQWSEVPLPGKIKTFTWIHQNLEEKKLSTPSCLAFIEFRGITGGLIHYLGKVERNQVRSGLKVVPVYESEEKRSGSILDIKFFTKE